MDTNQNIYEKIIGKYLIANGGLNMKDVVGEFTGKQIGAAFFRASNPFDSIWSTQDIEVAGACVIPYVYGVRYISAMGKTNSKFQIFKCIRSGRNSILKLVKLKKYHLWILEKLTKSTLFWASKWRFCIFHVC